jgi:hypothetical protein
MVTTLPAEVGTFVAVIEKTGPSYEKDERKVPLCDATSICVSRPAPEPRSGLQRICVVVTQDVERQSDEPITAVGVLLYVMPKLNPVRVIPVLVDKTTLLGPRYVTTFESNVKVLARVPAIFERVTLIGKDVPTPGDASHLTVVVVIQEVVVQIVFWTDIVGVIEYSAKLSPLMVTVEPAETPMFALESEATGASYV